MFLHASDDTRRETKFYNVNYVETLEKVYYVQSVETRFVES